ncbi:MAG TPA: hypothetical protein VK745_27740 [Polyangiaceae bacterium]|jgi:hypothetical protein|nr:hypothetical protein [Polyangiaceae bacterium]
MNAPVRSDGGRQDGRRRSTQAAAAELLAAAEALCRAARVLAELGTRQTEGDRRPTRAAPTASEDRLSSKQLGAIRAVSRRAGLSRDQLAQLLDEMTGKPEPAALSRSDASLVLDRLSEMTGYTR